jgi:hypothetical protein
MSFPSACSPSGGWAAATGGPELARGGPLQLVRRAGNLAEGVRVDEEFAAFVRVALPEPLRFGVASLAANTARSNAGGRRRTSLIPRY